MRRPTGTGRPTRNGSTHLTWGALLALGLMITGCGSGDDDAGGDTSSTTAAPAAVDERPDQDDADGDDSGIPAPTDAGTDDCIEAAEVAEVVGSDVELTSSFGASFGTDVTYSYQGCQYDVDDDTSYDISSLTVDGEDAGTAFDALDEAARADLAEDGFSPIADLGDDAYLDGGGVAVRQGSVMFTVEVETAEGEADPTRAEQLAAALLSTDLTDDDGRCRALADEFESVVGPVEREQRGGSSSSVGGVEISLGSCVVFAADDTSAKLAAGTAERWDSWVEAKRESSFTAWYRSDTIGEYASFDDGGSLFVDTPGRPMRVTIVGWKGSALEGDAMRRALAELALGR